MTLFGSLFKRSDVVNDIINDIKGPETVRPARNLAVLPYFPSDGKTWNCPPNMDYVVLSTEELLHNSGLYGDARYAVILVINNFLKRGWTPPSSIVTPEGLKKYLDDLNPTKEEKKEEPNPDNEPSSPLP